VKESHFHSNQQRLTAKEISVGVARAERGRCGARKVWGGAVHSPAPAVTNNKSNPQLWVVAGGGGDLVDLAELVAQQGVAG
jgi:hypothetical protein